VTVTVTPNQLLGKLFRNLNHSPTMAAVLIKSTLLAALLLVTPSCFTMITWGFEPVEETNELTGREESFMQYDPETEWSWELVGLRILITPLMLGLDIATAPIQAFFFWDDDDDC